MLEELETLVKALGCLYVFKE